MGGLLHKIVQNEIVIIIFGSFLIFAGMFELPDFSERLRFKGTVVWLAGGISGLFSSLVENQGGIRFAA